MSYGTDAPAYWDPSLAGDKSSTLEQEQCVIKDEHFFVRGRLVIPVTDAAPGTEFDWESGCPPSCRCTSRRRSR
jgi:hypothetical protein